jgi:hypothetical protein
MIYILDDDLSVGTNLARPRRVAGFAAPAFASAEGQLEVRSGFGGLTLMSHHEV